MPETFQKLIFSLQDYWAREGCIIMQPFDLEMGAIFWDEGANFLHGIFPYIRNPSFSTQESVQVSWQSAILVTQCRAKYSHTKPSCTSNVNFVPLTSFRWRTLMRIGGSFVELFSLSDFALRLSCSSRPNWNYPMPASSTPAPAPPGLNVPRANPSIHIARSLGVVYFHIFRITLIYI